MQEKTIEGLNRQIDELLSTIERYKGEMEDVEQWYCKRGQAEAVRYELAKERWIRTSRDMERQIRELTEKFVISE